MASNVIPFPARRVTYRAEIQDARDHIAHINSLLPGLAGLKLEMALIVRDCRQKELDGYLSPQMGEVA